MTRSIEYYPYTKDESFRDQLQNNADRIRRISFDISFITDLSL